MLRALYSGVSGMRQFQLKLDVVANNIANVNTVGFKKSRVMFQDILSQTIAGASTPQAPQRGGTNPRQVGLGVMTASIDTVFTPGSPMTTNVPTDLYIDGDGFFVLVDTQSDAQSLGNSNQNQNQNQNQNPNINANYYLTRNGSFHVDAYGYLVSAQGKYVVGIDAETGNFDIIRINPAQYSSFTISPDGKVKGIDKNNGNEVDIATIQLAKIPNPEGLLKVGENLYKVTANAITNNQIFFDPKDPNEKTGAVIAGMLEMSNVDLTEEFTEMIISQRGFQANARIITTSDEILQEVVNLKR